MSGTNAAASSRDLTGTRLGPYEILGRLGKGGMGEVYRARDTRLAREVAVKVLPEEFLEGEEKKQRFEREARLLAALSHPGIAAVYSFEEIPGSSASSLAPSPARHLLVMELVEGRTLRETLAAGPLPSKRLLDLACQIADGLARAHEVGIVHRDLKPENIMVSKDGFTKILDFGLAKRLPVEGGASPSEATMTAMTEAGLIVGTAGYMSPEQAGGRPVDFRADQFSFGSILYEMAAGVRAFQKKTGVETLSAILNEEPKPVGDSNPTAPPPLRWIIERCLAKDPAGRYASTQDLAQELKTVRDHLAEMSGVSAGGWSLASRRSRVPGLVAIAVVIGGCLGFFLVGKRAGGRPTPDFQRLTYGHGAVVSARFAPDGRTIVYGAAWDGDPVRLYSTRTDGRDSTRLEVPDADVVSVSSLGEIAMLLGRTDDPLAPWVGTLARAPLAGGAPRELTEDVSCADWSPDGKSLAIVRRVGKAHRLEFPVGKVLYETNEWIETIRVSPAADRVAFLVRGAGVSVEIVDVGGRHSVLSGRWKRGAGLAWSPDGSEVWFGANEREWRTPLYAVSLTGKRRLVMRLPIWIELQDVARDGHVLVSLIAFRTRLRGLAPGESAERDLAWHEGSQVKGMTPDGKTLLFYEGNEGSFHGLYVRPMDGSAAKRIGEGRAMAISSDGRWVAANTAGRGSPSVLLPTGAGEPQALDDEGHRFVEAAFFPGGKRLLLLARDAGHGDRSYVRDLPAGKLRSIAPEGVSCQVVSPDGEEAACVGPRGEGAIYRIEGGSSRPIAGFLSGAEQPVTWSSDGRALFVGPVGVATSFRRSSDSTKVFRLDLRTGKRELWHEFVPADRAALPFPLSLAMTPDGASYAYSSFNAPSDLYLVTGLK